MGKFTDSVLVGTTTTGEKGTLFDKDGEIVNIGDLFYLPYGDYVEICVVINYSAISREVQLANLTHTESIYYYNYNGVPNWWEVDHHVERLPKKYLINTFPEDWLVEFLKGKTIHNLDELDVVPDGS